MMRVMPEKKKKKVDYEALNSPFMKIPRMKVDAARSLLDLGLSEVYELEGRDPDFLFSELSKKQDEIAAEHLHYFRMATYFAENPEPDPALMHPSAWS